MDFTTLFFKLPLTILWVSRSARFMTTKFICVALMCREFETFSKSTFLSDNFLRIILRVVFGLLFPPIFMASNCFSANKFQIKSCCWVLFVWMGQFVFRLTLCFGFFHYLSVWVIMLVYCFSSLFVKIQQHFVFIW